MPKYAILIAVSEVKVVKEGIHPKMKKVTVNCACGASFETASTRDDLKVEICSQCHPLYTGGKSKVVDTGGRVEKFKKKYNLQ